MKRILISALATFAIAASAANVTWGKLGLIDENNNVVTDVTLPGVVPAAAAAGYLDVTIITNVVNGTTTSYAVKVKAPSGFDPSGLQDAIDDLCDSTNALQSAVEALDSGKANKATTLSGYGITDTVITNGVVTIGGTSIKPLTSFSETDPTVPSWAKDANKPSYTFSEINSTPTTLAGYGISDASIANGTISIGGQSITPLTSFNETDPNVPSWAKEANKPSYTASEVGAVADDALDGHNWANDGITGKISNLHETIIAVEKLIEALGGDAPVDPGN